MPNDVFITPTVEPFVRVLNTVLDKFLPPHQYDAHVWCYKTIIQAYGSVAGYNARVLEFAMKRQFKRLVEEG